MNKLMLRFNARYLLATSILMFTVACPAQPGRNVRFEIDNNTVLDTETGLRWQRCSVGQTWKKNNTCAGIAKKMKFTDAAHLNDDIYSRRNQKIANTGWRTPTKNELATLVDMTRSPYRINTQLFPDIDENNVFYWSTDMKNSGQAWFAAFTDGSVDYVTGDHPNAEEKWNVRLVHVER